MTIDIDQRWSVEELMKHPFILNVSADVDKPQELELECEPESNENIDNNDMNINDEINSNEIKCLLTTNSKIKNANHNTTYNKITRKPLKISNNNDSTKVRENNIPNPPSILVNSSFFFSFLIKVFQLEQVQQP